MIPKPGEVFYHNENMKDTNPKDMVASNKIPMHLWPETATILGCVALLEGMLKYGRTNWRDSGVRASVYVDACRRHLNAWFEGEENAPDSGIPHLGHALACIAILVDVQFAGKLKDDRMIPGGYQKALEMVTPHVARLKEKYKDLFPKHYTIQDRAHNEYPSSAIEAAIKEVKCGEISEGHPKTPDPDA